MKFTLIGDGQVAKYHRKAIEHVEGEIVCVIDSRHELRFGENNIPYSPDFGHTPPFVFAVSDYYVICSPSNFHRSQIQYLLSNLNSTWKEFQIICEKPAFLPWEQIIDDDRINIVLQLRYIMNLPKKAEKVVAHFLRDEAYFKSWKGDPKNTGGLFYNLFIHYIDLAIQLNADFQGSINQPGKHLRKIEYGRFGLEVIDIEKINTQSCYNRMYEDILSGGGIKPKDIFYLNWILHRNSEIFGYGRNGIGKTIKIGKELL